MAEIWRAASSQNPDYKNSQRQRASVQSSFIASSLTLLFFTPLVFFLRGKERKGNDINKRIVELNILQQIWAAFIIKTESYS